MSPVDAFATFIPLKGCPCKLCTRNIATVKPFVDFIAEVDAQALRAALKGLGTDNAELTRILGNRTYLQRNQIRVAYQKLFDRDLVADLKSDLSGHFERLVVALFYPWPQHNAHILEKALNGFWGSDERTVVDLLTTASNCELKEIKLAYKQVYGKELEADLKVKLNGDIRDVLLEVLKGLRVENEVADPVRAQEDAKKLQFRIGGVIHGTNQKTPKLDKSVLLRLLTTDSFPQLVELQRAYGNLTGLNLEAVLDAEYSGDFLYALKTILHVAKNRSLFFAERIHATIARLGTDDKALINLVVLRSEIDLGNIAVEYENLYKSPLATDVSKDLAELYNKHYRNLILDIIN